MENGVAADEATAKGGMLDVGDLCRMFEESEDSSYESRKLSERDRDYVDNKQLTAKELKTFEIRGQPPVIDNRIKTKIDYLVGLEKQQRIDPKALPRTPKHEGDADGATEALRYVAEEQDYDSKRSGVWRNILVEGYGGIGVSVAEAMDYNGQPGIEVRIRRYSWDRLFFDPHSSETDFSDAGYLGAVLWMDYDDALAMYKDNPDAANILDVTLTTAPSDTYDDKPKHSLWADKKRKRVRICQIWVKRDEQWHFAEYTKGGILKAGPSPYKTDKGESDCELVLQSAYCDRDNNRYGLVREMISLQDEINKRRSKSLHLLSANQTLYEEGAIDNIELFRREKAKADGTMKVAPGALANQRVQTISGVDVATAQFQLLQESKNAIDLKGPNATEMGDKTQGSNAASGRAIVASQQGGMIQIGDLMDNLRHLDRRVFRAMWNRIRQYWTAEKWIRVTDDDQNVKWVGVNVDPQQIQMLAAQDPQAAQKIAGIVGNVAELDCDIIIDEAPDSLSPQLEQFQSLVELKKFDTEGEIPFKSIVRAAPNLKGKQAILNEMEQRAEQKAQASKPAQELQMRGAQAEVAETESKAALNIAKAHEAGMPDQAQQPQQGQYEAPAELQNAKIVAEIEKLLSEARKSDATTAKTEMETSLAPMQAAHQVSMDRDNFRQGVQDRAADRKLAARKPQAA
ncbi:MAG: hypothetical protein KBE22_12995 [Candidatus Accumulibacter sp.]|nr:hypothetical protein [Accumulibacter sp.]